MARIKEVVSRSGKKGTVVVKARGKTARAKMSDKALKKKNTKNKAIMFAGLGGYPSARGKRGKRIYTGGGF